MLPTYLNKGEKSICIDNKNINFYKHKLILYKTYTFLETSKYFHEYIYIDNYSMLFHNKHFVTLKEFRLMKLKEIYATK